MGKVFGYVMADSFDGSGFAENPTIFQMFLKCFYGVHDAAACD